MKNPDAPIIPFGLVIFLVIIIFIFCVLHQEGLVN